MNTQILDIEQVCAGPCAECGMIVARRIRCFDKNTHSRVILCEVCWAVFQQRQVFGSGCCG